MNLQTITPAPFDPVTLQECYAHLRLDPDGSPAEHPDDSMLRRHIATATQEAESLCRRSFVQRTLRLHVECFGCGITLLRPPVLSVQSVRYYDAANALQTVDPASWYVTDDLVPQVRFVTSFARPALYQRPDAVRVDYTAGYAPQNSPADGQADFAANVPNQFKDAILLGVQLLYDSLSPEQRERLEKARESLLSPSRIQLSV